MTEQITRGYFELLHELFFAGKGEDGKPMKSALDQYAKVRHTQYEMNLWRCHGVPLGQVDNGAKSYFSERFLLGREIRKSDAKTLDAAFERLDHAVKDGCHGRCARLVNELNSCTNQLGLDTVDTEKFLNFMTFNYHTRKDEYGYAKKEPGFSFEIRDFVDEFYRNLFREEVRLLEKQRRAMSLRGILSIVNFRVQNSRVLKK